MTISAEERAAIYEKMEHPEREVACPRCGGKLIHEEIGTSSVTRCEREGCLRYVIRGI